MSEYTTCNYCKLQSIRRDAKIKRKRIVIVSAGFNRGLGGFDIYRLSNKGEKPDKKKNWVCWFMVIGEVCGC